MLPTGEGTEPYCVDCLYATKGKRHKHKGRFFWKERLVIKNENKQGNRMYPAELRVITF